MSLGSRLGIGFMRAIAPLPLPLVRGFGALLGRVLHTVAVPRRRVVDTNLAVCFPGKSEAERRRIARETFVYVAQSWLDRSWLWHAPEKVVASRLKVVGAAQEIREIADGDEPMILFAPHFYGLDAAATALTMHTARPSATIYTTQRDPMVDAWIREGRTRFGNVAALNRVAGIKQVVGGLREGGLLCLLPDMNFGRDQSIFVPFYGVQAATVPSLSRFARLGRAKVVPLLTKLTPERLRRPGEAGLAELPDRRPRGRHHPDERAAAGLHRRMPSQYYWVHQAVQDAAPGGKPIY
jgi:KDO2-lipid IV(A) lauroyltransferase